MTLPAAPRVPAGDATAAPRPDRLALARSLGKLVLLSLVFVAIGLYPPVRQALRPEALQELARRGGWWGPLLLAAAGVLTPLALLPRWPIAFAGGLLYGIGWGSLLANVASTAGAWLQFQVARGAVGPAAARLVARSRWHRLLSDRRHAFLAVFLLRAFPLSNFVATNLLAGSLRLPLRTYLAATFLGMVPSTLMYAAWGKLVRQPSRDFQYLLAGVLLFLVVGTLLAQRRLAARRDPAAGDASGEPGGTAAS